MLPLVTNPVYSFPFADTHRFPMQKFRLLHDHLTNLGIATDKNVYRPGRARQDVLELAHCPDYVSRFINNQLSIKEMRRLGLPWSQGLVNRTLISPNGTLLTAHLALRHGVACHLAGGTHHAYYNFGSGFCILNDLAITALVLLAQKKVTRVLIFDCDVHQGDGTAAILANNPQAITCSIHCAKNFPARKQISDIDVEVPPGMQDQDYLEIVSTTLDKAIAQHQPDLILYDAGVDVFTADPLGLIDISLEGIRQREALVLNKAIHAGIAIATVIGGGYDKDQLALARRHAIVIEEAAKLFDINLIKHQ